MAQGEDPEEEIPYEADEDVDYGNWEYDEAYADEAEEGVYDPGEQEEEEEAQVSSTRFLSPTVNCLSIRKASPGLQRPDRISALIAELVKDPVPHDEKFVLWDSGATHALLPSSFLQDLPSEEQKKARAINVHLAAGSRQALMVNSEIYAKGVEQSICPVGRTLRVLRA